MKGQGMIQQAMEQLRKAAEHEAKPLELSWEKWQQLLPDAFPPDEVCEDLKTYLTHCVFEPAMDIPTTFYSRSELLESFKDEDFFAPAAEKGYFPIGVTNMDFTCVDWRTGTVYIIVGYNLSGRSYYKEKRYKSLKTFLRALVDEAKEYLEGIRDSERIQAEFEEASETDPDAFDEYGFTQLHKALLEGDLEKAKQELDRGARLDLTTRDGRTPVQIAAARAYADILRLLLELGCDPNERGGNDNPPLIDAAQSGTVDIFRTLIDAGADLTLKSGRGESLIQVVTALSGDRSDVVRFLLEQGADPAGELNRINGNYWSLLLEFGAEPMQDDGKIVGEAVYSGKVDQLQLLVDAGADLSSVDGLATRARTLEMLKVLAETGVDLTGKDACRTLVRESTAVLARTRVEKAEALAMAEFLLDQGADPNVPAAGGTTALIGAASKKNYKAISLLLARGADPTIRDSRDWTALDYAKHYKCRKAAIKEIEKAIKAHKPDGG